eukprot:6161109-Amphidinium_carterae.2
MVGTGTGSLCVWYELLGWEDVLQSPCYLRPVCADRSPVQWRTRLRSRRPSKVCWHGPLPCLPGA